MKTHLLTVCLLLGSFFSISFVYGDNFPAVSNAQSKIDLYGNKDIYQKVSLSKIAEDVVYIPLETTNESLLSEELQIYYGKDDLFVGDQQTNTFYRFDKTGKFLNKIGNKGNGPEEYPSALYFYVDEASHSLFLISPQTKTLYQYTYEGKFQRKITFEESPWMVQKAGNDFLFYNQRFNRIENNKNIKELFLANSEGKTIQSLPTTIVDTQMDMLLFEMPFFYRYGENIYYKNPLLDDVYKVKIPLELEPVYTIYTGPMVRSKNDIRNPQNLAQQVSVRNMVETDHHLFIVYAYQEAFHCLLVNKSDGSCSNVKNNQPGFVEDLKEGPDFLPYWMASSSQNVLISLLTEEKREKQMARFQNVTHKQKELGDRKAGDNPVVVIARLK